jgi:hypothetical protein
MGIDFDLISAALEITAFHLKMIEPVLNWCISFKGCKRGERYGMYDHRKALLMRLEHIPARSTSVSFNTAEHRLW